MRFYPAYKYDEVMDMPISLFRKLNEAITILEARECLREMTINDYANCNKSEPRKRLHSRFYKQAFPPSINPDDEKYASAEEIERLFGSDK